jgi:hypothetical protein
MFKMQMMAPPLANIATRGTPVRTTQHEAFDFHDLRSAWGVIVDLFVNRHEIRTPHEADIRTGPAETDHHHICQAGVLMAGIKDDMVPDLQGIRK